MIPGAYEKIWYSDVVDVGFLWRSGLGGRVYYTKSDKGKTGWLLGLGSVEYRGWSIFKNVAQLADDERLLSVCLHIHNSTYTGTEDPWKVKFYYGVTSNATNAERWTDTGDGFWEENFGSDPSGTHNLFIPESAWSDLWNAQGHIELKLVDNCSGGGFRPSGTRYWYPEFGTPGSIRTWLILTIQRQPKIHHSLTGG